ESRPSDPGPRPPVRPPLPPHHLQTAEERLQVGRVLPVLERRAGRDPGFPRRHHLLLPQRG
ncbi:unnamed protein product, partial [Darwinula stevensoni]